MDLEEIPHSLADKQVSYLRAWDSSILAGNKGALLRHKGNLVAEQLEEENPAEQKIANEPTLHNIQIYLRVKQVDSLGDLYDLDNNAIHCSVPEGSHGSRNTKHGQYVKRTYTFTYIFGPTASQEEVFNYTVKPKLLDLLNGKNSTLMTYGASGSGKTFTIVGTPADPGVIPRALEYLFGSLPQLSDCPRVKPTPTGVVSILSELMREAEKNTRNMLLNILNSTIDKQHIRTYQAMQERLSCEPVAEVEIKQHKDVSIAVWVSFAEIYNEQVFDLLVPEPIRGKPRTKLLLGKSCERSYIKNLTNVSVSNGLEAYQILQYGLHNLKYAATAINSHSSRSHCIFTIKLVQAIESKDDNYHVSYFNFCDLAGSERSKKTLNAGDRLKESNNINTSLMVLGRCISLIRDAQLKKDNNMRIPYRDSKLTMLFQTALSGKEDIAMIVNINPSLQMFDETSHVLNFSAIAKQIAIRSERLNSKPKKEEEKASMDDNSHLEEEIAKLKGIIVELYNEREQEKNQVEENWAKVVTDYRKLIRTIEKSWQDQLKSMEERCEKDKKRAIDDLREEYESTREDSVKRFKGVINLDSDSEDEEEPECRCQELRVQVNTLQAELSKCKFEKQVLETEVARLREENENLHQGPEEVSMSAMSQDSDASAEEQI